MATPFSRFRLHEIGRGLPVARTQQAIESALLEHNCAVIQAPPGSGKTTFVPPLIHNLKQGKVLVVTPRRVAVRAAAHRLSVLSRTPIGDMVGFSIRGQYSPGSAVEFLTPGVLLRHLLNDPELPGIAAVIIDEVHERQLETDLVLAMLAELRQLRDDLTVVAMSATLDATKFANFIDAPTVTSHAESYPVEVRYAPAPDRLSVSRTFLDHVSKLACGHEDSVLVFVPGVREVEYVCEQIGDLAIPLHGRQTPAEQERAFLDRRRIVVATAIAESSVTVPGVRVVIDAGLSRVPRRDTTRNMTGLVTESCTRSQAEQRAGRAGREGPGLAIRCYSEREFQHFKPNITPEIQTSDLTQAALIMACWGPLELIDAPPPAALASAQETLARIGAVHNDKPTEVGRRLVQIPADPRLARALIDAAPLTGSRAAAKAVSFLAYGDTSDARRFEKMIDYVPDTGLEASALVTAFAFPEHIAMYAGDTYMLASGTRAEADGYTAPWIAIAEIQRTGNRATIRKAFPIQEEMVFQILPIEEEVTATLDNQGKAIGRKVRRIGAIELSSTPIALTDESRWNAVANGFRTGKISLPEAHQRIRNRMEFLHTNVGSPWPAVDDANLHQRIAEWFNPDLSINLRNLIPWELVNEFDHIAPSTLRLPSGNERTITYEHGRAILKVKLQECFGLTESPVIANQKIQFHLLSPAGRPVAVTDDLASFWAGPYNDVRKEMRGRYPKHPWPEDPLTAQATAQPKRPTKRG